MSQMRPEIADLHVDYYSWDSEGHTGLVGHVFKRVLTFRDCTIVNELTGHAGRPYADGLVRCRRRLAPMLAPEHRVIPA